MRVWTPETDLLLRAHWGQTNPSEIAELINECLRSREHRGSLVPQTTDNGVVYRAAALGLISSKKQEEMTEAIVKQRQRLRARPPIPHEVRKQVMARDGVCQICGTNERLSLDHVVSYSKGGPADVGNLWVLCKECNSRKGARSYPLALVEFARRVTLPTIIRDLPVEEELCCVEGGAWFVRRSVRTLRDGRIWDAVFLIDRSGTREMSHALLTLRFEVPYDEEFEREWQRGEAFFEAATNGSCGCDTRCLQVDFSYEHDDGGGSGSAYECLIRALEERYPEVTVRRAQPSSPARSRRR